MTGLIKRGKDLNVYKRAFTVSLEIHSRTLGFPKIEQYALADQLRRSSKSICANVGEGFAKQKYSSAEFGRFIGMAEGSAEETLVWLQYAQALGYITTSEYDVWENEYIAIIAMLAKLRKVALNPVS